MTHFSLRVSPALKTELIVSVSKKVAKQAVTRNLIKRRVRAAFRTLLPSLKDQKYLFIARVGVEKIRGKELEAELRELISRSNKL